MGDVWDWVGGIIGISLIGGRLEVEDIQYRLVQEVSKILEIGLIGGVVTLRDEVVNTVWETELVKLDADREVSEEESMLSKFCLRNVFQKVIFLNISFFWGITVNFTGKV